jgi:hypothetical protein
MIAVALWLAAALWLVVICLTISLATVVIGRRNNKDKK